MDAGGQRSAEATRRPAPTDPRETASTLTPPFACMGTGMAASPETPWPVRYTRLYLLHLLRRWCRVATAVDKRAVRSKPQPPHCLPSSAAANATCGGAGLKHPASLNSLALAKGGPSLAHGIRICTLCRPVRTSGFSAAAGGPLLLLHPYRIEFLWGFAAAGLGINIVPARQVVDGLAG